ncbi:MAG: hypothetical protein NTV34_21990, partial [Proteobacteria bacterium]|nr:hypothetical protein [Pseudomonadota bacterium]
MKKIGGQMDKVSELIAVVAKEICQILTTDQRAAEFDPGRSFEMLVQRLPLSQNHFERPVRDKIRNFSK